MLATCKRAEKEQQAETGEVLEESSEAEENKAFTQFTFYSNDLNFKGLVSKRKSTDIENKDDWEDDTNNSQHKAFVEFRYIGLSSKRSITLLGF